MKNILAVYNGSFDFLDKIKISPLSRAYTFSDSVYEVIPFYNSKIIAFDEHIARLEKSCEALSFSIKILDISNEILELIKKSKEFVLVLKINVMSLLTFFNKSFPLILSIAFNVGIEKITNTTKPAKKTFK